MAMEWKSTASQAGNTGKQLVSFDNPKKIKNIQFSMFNSQDVVKMAEFEVTHRDLYTAGPARATAANGVLDRRLTCARVLLEEDDRRAYLKRFRRPNLENILRQSLAKQVNTACRKMVYCPYCNATNGVVKKAGLLRIVHEKFRAKKTHGEMEKWKETFKTAVENEKQIAPLLNRAHEDLNPLKVLDLFRRISAEDCELLGSHPKFGRPEEMIWQYISVPPACIRPSVAQDGATNEDDITVKLAEIAFNNSILRMHLNKGAGTQQIVEQWNALSECVAVYINSETPGLPPNSGKPLRGFCQRLKGKQGRFRGNLSGKRVDFSGRTVISPDPNLRIDEVAVPERVAKVLTYPERVTEVNIERLRQAVRNGWEKHPGAAYVYSAGANVKRTLQKAHLRDDLADKLEIGDIVERHVIDGEFTEEARTEALELMSVKKNLVTPRNGEPVISAIQDFITAAWLLSQRDRFFDRRQFTQICCYFNDANLQIDIPPPTIWKPKRLWTGKQIFNCMMKPNKDCKVLVNLESKCATFHKPDPKKWPPGVHIINDLSPNDGWLVIRNSEVMCGVMDKATVGGGKKTSVFSVIIRDYGPDEAALVMNRLAKTAARWLANIGFSLGINDVIPGPILSEKKNEMVERAYADCQQLIEKAKMGKLENKPGCDQEQTLEALISGVLSKVRGDVGDICMRELSRYNAPLIMATCGSKGSTINVSQMVACVGQQIISGKRVPDGFQDRALPHFPKKSREPPSKGFVRNSFFTGLSPTEFLFHAISGREGLVDTAVKTAETGYMQRRLMKALEDLTTQYDLSVRNSVGGVVQFRYGDDGLDPQCLEGEAQPIQYGRAWSHALSIGDREGRGLMPYEIMEITDRELNSERFRADCTAAYIATVRGFVLDKVVRRAVKIREQHGMFGAEVRQEEWDEDTDLSMGARPDEVAIVENKTKVTESQLRTFLDICARKYIRAKIEPGSTVGAVGAQSIGEPGTQMTLKTFHFAGVASMNVTLGVPRIKEIINAAKNISTPIITCKLVSSSSEQSARIVKGRVEKTYLGDVASVIEEVWGPDTTFVGIHVDVDAIRKLQLELTMEDIRNAIVQAKKLKIKIHNVLEDPLHKNRIKVHVDGENKYYQLKALKRALPGVVVKGIPTISRAIINILDKTSERGRAGDKELLVEGYGLQKVMTTEGIVGEETTSNHVMEVQTVLGIEAARRKIIDEIQYTMSSHGMSIDPRHVMLLGDVMSYKGEVLGITRFGVAKMKDSVLMLASFEKTTDHLFDAAAYSKSDSIAGVSESIIMGNPANNCGTSFRDYSALVIGALLIILEIPIRLITLCLPERVIQWFYSRSRLMFHRVAGHSGASAKDKKHIERIRAAPDFEELCAIWGYEVEDHYLQTKDGYLLCLHRIPGKKGQARHVPGSYVGKPVVYLHHGLLMNSEVWVCLTDEERCLPFALAEQGYDVWFGNNRGNKYSKKAIYCNAHERQFWDYSIDEFCMHDIPNSIDYILETTQAPKLSYIGFSQGTAQAFAALSINPRLNQKVSVFVGLAPAMRPHGLSARFVDALMKASPTLVFLFFGRKAILPSTVFWQSILYPPIFVKIIDTCLTFLFNWRGENIPIPQKLAAYSHLYSYTSTKAVVHWFQIMRSGKFLMYDDHVQSPNTFVRTYAYAPARFPTKNISTPIVLLYGDCDTLIDIDTMLKELPSHTVAYPVPGHEHLDVLWGRDVGKLVIPRVLETLRMYSNLKSTRK
ncbi:hypothetical protein FS837_004207 [Tulasnella sp. UAMH 9824]|nr:hypothetical protein FS837_004207 [Tulasnella sp. UAMH 9824]